MSEHSGSAALLVLLLALPACEGGLEGVTSGVFPGAVDMAPNHEALPGLEDELRGYEYPTFKNADGTVSRILWVKRNQGALINDILKEHPDWQAVAFKQVPEFLSDPNQIQDKKTKQGWAPASGSEGLMLTGPVEAVNKATDLVSWVLSSVANISIEARVVEVLESEEFGFGVDWFLLDVQDQTFGDPLVPSKRLFNRATIGRGLPTLPGGVASTFVPDVLVELGTIQNNIQVDLLIQALKLFTKVDVVNAPNVAVLEGHTARISAGQEVPFFNLTLNGNNTSITTDFKDVSVNLEVIPRLISKRTIRMIVRAEVRNVTDVVNVSVGNQQVANPVIADRSVQTVIDVPDGNTVVLGGLLTNTKIEVDDQVPFLGEIPVLDILFRNRRKLDSRNNLIFFLRPKVLHTGVEDDREVILPPEDS